MSVSPQASKGGVGVILNEQTGGKPMWVSPQANKVGVGVILDEFERFFFRRDAY
jgi:hypothetical protein